MPTANSGVNTFNYVRQNSSNNFRDIVPEATIDNIGTLSNILFDDAYQPQLNEFVTNLINRIALTIISNKSYNNPLSMFKKGSIPLGTDIQDIYTNPAESEPYELSNTAMAKLLTITDPDTKVAYYRRNRQDLYTKTIAREALQGAFVSWDKFNEFISSITTSLYSGNYIDEFNYTKELLDGAYDSGKVITQVVTAPTTEANAKSFVKTLRTLYKKLSFPSTEYNAYSKFNPDKTPVKTWTTEERVCVIIPADISAEIDIDVLAQAFNIDKANLLGRVIEIDHFENPEIQAVICDESFLQIYDNVLRFDEFYNARTMSWNEYLHAWSVFAISPFANAVFLVTENSTPATAIAIGDGADVEITGIGTTEGLEITLTPATATSDVTFKSSNAKVFTTSKTDNKNVKVTSTGVGTAVLTATTDNGLKAQVNIVVKEA